MISILLREIQSLFKYDNGNTLHFYRQDSPTQWAHFSIPVPHGEGLKIADMDHDSNIDVVVNCYWYKNPGQLSPNKPWMERSYCKNWNWSDVFIDVADINNDGFKDVVFTPSEIAGKPLPDFMVQRARQR